MQVNEKKAKQTHYDYMVEGVKSEAAEVAGRRKPYHLQYAEQYRNNPILNPKMEGDRHENEMESGDRPLPAGNRRHQEGSEKGRNIRRIVVGTLLTECNSICGPKARRRK